MSPRPDYTEALAMALAGLEPQPGVEDVPLADAAGRVLRAPVIADRDLPPFDRAQMDGYALRADEIADGDAWPVERVIAAGQPAGGGVPAGHCVAIATGAPLPDDVDTVIQHELSDRGDPVRFTTPARTFTRGHAVHRRGADACEGDLLVGDGTTLAARHLGIAASAGLTTLTVAARPRVAILTSGDEVLPAGETVAAHQIRNSNQPMLSALVARLGAEVIATEHLPDEMAITTDRVGAMLKTCDVLVTVGGISAGDRDHFHGAFAAHDVTLALAGAAIQPGKPIAIGRAPNGTSVVGLPGNPVSGLVCACLFLWPIIRARLGATGRLPWRHVTLREPVRPNPDRRAFRPVRLMDGDQIVVPSWAGSGDLAHTAITDGIAELPVQAEPVAAESRLRFLAWP